jgi:hypothetical protein
MSSWLEEMTKQILNNLPRDMFTDWTFGYGDIQRVVELVEKAIASNAAETTEARRSAASKAAADPFHDYIKTPVFTPQASEFWKAELMFPRVLRSALMIAIYSHTEYLLLSWCESIAPDPSAPKSLRKLGDGESYPARYLRYLRDDGKLDLGDFTKWPEWDSIDGYRRARNCLAHRGGIVESEEDKAKIGALKQFNIDDSGLQISESLVHLLPGACEAACELAKAFIARAVAVAERDPRWNGPKRASP